MPNFISGIKFNYSLHKKFWSFYKINPIPKGEVIASTYELQGNKIISHYDFTLEDVIALRTYRNNCAACQYAQEHIDNIVANPKKYFKWPTRLCNYCPFICGNGSYECLGGLHSTLVNSILELVDTTRKFNPEIQKKRRQDLLPIIMECLDKIINAELFSEVELF